MTEEWKTLGDFKAGDKVDMKGSHYNPFIVVGKEPYNRDFYVASSKTYGVAAWDIATPAKLHKPKPKMAEHWPAVVRLKYYGAKIHTMEHGGLFPDEDTAKRYYNENEIIGEFIKLDKNQTPVMLEVEDD